MNRSYCFALLVVATSPVLAMEQQPVADTQYRYGMQLDIAEVVKVTATPSEGATYPATMEYVDHQGQTHRVAYIVTETTWGGNQ